MSLADRLQRLLLLVSTASARPIRIEELAKRLDCSVEEVERDIDTVSLVGVPPFDPGDLIDIAVEDGWVSVDIDQGFGRPTRLTATEAAAVTASARALAPEDPALGSALAKLSEAVAPGQRPLFDALVRQLGWAPAEAPGQVASTLTEAIDRQLEVEIQYFAQTELSARPRTVRPRAIGTIDGVSYLSAQNSSGGERMYRLDRIARAELTANRFDPLPEIDLRAALAKVARLGRSHDLPRAVVRFAPAVADAIRARFRDIRDLDDESIEASIAYTTVPWLVSFVLSWGGQARIVEPAEAREALRDSIARALEAHAD